MEWNYLNDMDQGTAPPPPSRTYHLTDKDYQKAYEYLYRNSKPGKKALLLYRTVLGVILLLALLPVVRDINFTSILTLVVFGGIFLFACIRGGKQLAKTNVRTSKKRYKQCPQELYGPFSVYLTDEGVHIKSSMSDHCYRYEAIQNIYFDEENIFFFYDFNQAVSVISCSAFCNQEERDVFLQQVEQKKSNHVG